MPQIAKSASELFGKFPSTHMISPLPDPGPEQRGPTCGFYALAYVLSYWHKRFEKYGGEYKITEPLKARTENAAPREKGDDLSEKALKEEKALKAERGEFSSLRHYGKYNKLTQVGSIFNAADVVRVAKGENSQYAGQFDGHVINLGSTAEFETKVKALIDIECPVIVPFDVSGDGDPTSKTGKAAHWVVIIGYHDVNRDVEVAYYNWGEFYTAKLNDFAVSNSQLTSNHFLVLQKYERRDPYDDNKLYQRDYMKPMDAVEARKEGWRMKPMSGIALNREYNDPTSKKERLMNGGLRNKIVAVYRKDDGKEVRAAAS